MKTISAFFAQQEAQLQQLKCFFNDALQSNNQHLRQEILSDIKAGCSLDELKRKWLNS